MASKTELKNSIKSFADDWAAYDGNEIKGKDRFWIDFVQRVLGRRDAVRLLDFEQRVRGNRIDAFMEDTGVLIEQKAPGTDMDRAEPRHGKMLTPYQQAKEYANDLPHSISPRWIITCNFTTFRIYDLDLDNPESEMTEVQLAELPKKAHLFDFMVSRESSRIAIEQDLSVKAGDLVASIYHALAAQYRNIESDAREQRGLNILVTRLVFLLYAEDAGLLQEKDVFLKYMRTVRKLKQRLRAFRYKISRLSFFDIPLPLRIQGVAA